MRRTLVVLEGAVGLSAVYGGVGLIANGLGMPADWLVGSPFGSWVLPGVFLLLVVAGPMLAAAVGDIVRAPWSYRASTLAAALLVGWIVVQLVVLRRYFFLQPVLLGVGLVGAGLARRTHPGERLLPQATKDNPGPR